MIELKDCPFCDMRPPVHMEGCFLDRILVKADDIKRFASAWNERAHQINPAVSSDAQMFHIVMQHLQNMNMEHGLCQPRERMACTNCNSREALKKIEMSYQGPRIMPAS